MNQPLPFYAALLACLCVANNGWAEEDFKCWKNESGVLECGNTIPPQFVSQGYEVRNENADVVQVEKREMSPEERNRLLEIERQKIEAEKQAKVQAEEDKRLLDLYPNERDIINARDLKILRINKSVEITQKDLNARKARLEKLKVQAERAAKRADKVSLENLATLQTHIASLENQIKTIQSSVDGKEQEKQEIMSEYSKTLDKYREIQARTRLIEEAEKNEERIKAQAQPQQR